MEPKQINLPKIIRVYEATQIREALERNSWNVLKTAKHLSMCRYALIRRIQKYRIKKS